MFSNGAPLDAKEGKLDSVKGIRGFSKQLPRGTSLTEGSSARVHAFCPGVHLAAHRTQKHGSRSLRFPAIEAMVKIRG